MNCQIRWWMMEGVRLEKNGLMRGSEKWGIECRGIERGMIVSLDCRGGSFCLTMRSFGSLYLLLSAFNLFTFKPPTSICALQVWMGTVKTVNSKLSAFCVIVDIILMSAGKWALNEVFRFSLEQFSSGIKCHDFQTGLAPHLRNEWVSFVIPSWVKKSDS